MIVAARQHRFLGAHACLLFFTVSERLIENEDSGVMFSRLNVGVFPPLWMVQPTGTVPHSRQAYSCDRFVNRGRGDVFLVMEARIREFVQFFTNPKRVEMMSAGTLICTVGLEVYFCSWETRL